MAQRPSEWLSGITGTAISDSSTSQNDRAEQVLEGCSYITVDTDYHLNLSLGQQRLYEVLVALKEGSIFTVTTVGKLSCREGIL